MEKAKQEKEKAEVDSDIQAIPPKAPKQPSEHSGLVTNAKGLKVREFKTER